MSGLAMYGWIGLGSGIGGMARFYLSQRIDGMSERALPWGTIAVNVLGSFLIGVLAASLLSFDRTAWSKTARLTFIVGFCGGFTTFSTFSLQTLNLLKSGNLGLAAQNVVISTVVCVLATGFGLWLVGGTD